MDRLVVFGLLVVACSSGGTATQGGSSSGGAPESGASNAGGAAASAGAGGVTQSGGQPTSTGGALATGASTSAGGSSAGGSATDGGATRSSGGSMDTGGVKGLTDGSTPAGAPVHGCYECDATTDCSALCGDMGGACPDKNCGTCSTQTSCCACLGAAMVDCSATTCPAEMICNRQLFLPPGCGSGSCTSTPGCAAYSLGECCLGSPRMVGGTKYGYCATTCP